MSQQPNNHALQLGERFANDYARPAISTILVQIPDTFCQDVITKKMTPQFKETKYFEGIQGGIKSLIDKLTR